MASGNLVETHMMVKRYWFPHLGAYAVNYHVAKCFLECWTGFKRSYRNLFVSFRHHLTNVTSLSKFCHTVLDLRPIEMVGYLAIGLINA